MTVAGKRVLVTGGAGFVPSHVVDLLVEGGASVTVVDDLSAGRKDNLRQVRKEVEFIELDVCSDLVGEIVKRQDVVIHMAANADVPKSVENPDYDFYTNVIGSYNVIRACLNSGVEKVLFASSAAVYGEPLVTPIGEDHPTSPISPYGAAKLAIEKLGLAYCSTFGLPFAVIRIFNTYGVRQPRYVMYDLLRKLYKDPERLEVLGTGAQIRDYSYVTDTARCFVLAAESERAVGEVYNVAGGNPISIRDLAGRLIAVLGLQDVDVTFTGKSWKGDITTLVADIGKAEQELGFSPQVSIDDGVRLLEDWLRQQPIPSRPVRAPGA